MFPAKKTKKKILPKISVPHWKETIEIVKNKNILKTCQKKQALPIHKS